MPLPIAIHNQISKTRMIYFLLGLLRNQEKYDYVSYYCVQNSYPPPSRQANEKVSKRRHQIVRKGYSWRKMNRYLAYLDDLSKFMEKLNCGNKGFK